MIPNPQLYYDDPIEAVAWGRYTISGKIHGVDYEGNIQGAGNDIILNKGEAISWHQRKGHSLTKEMMVFEIDYHSPAGVCFPKSQP